MIHVTVSVDKVYFVDLEKGRAVLHAVKQSLAELLEKQSTKFNLTVAFGQQGNVSIVSENVLSWNGVKHRSQQEALTFMIYDCQKVVNDAANNVLFGE